MQIEKNKIKTSIEEQIRIKEKKLEQEKNQLKILKKKLNEENRKRRNKRLIEKGAIFESIFTTTNKFTKDEYYELITYISTLDEIKIKIMEIEENKKENIENEDKKEETKRLITQAPLVYKGAIIHPKG